MEMIRSVGANSLESYIVMYGGHCVVRFQILKQIIVTGGQFITLWGSSYCLKPESRTVCWVIIDMWTGLQCWIYGRARGAPSRTPHI